MSIDFIGRGWSLSSFVPTMITTTPSRQGQKIARFIDNVALIEQSIRIILATYPGERVMRPEFGCRLQDLVFAPNNDETTQLATLYVSEALNRWEPRIDVISVTAIPTDNIHEREVTNGSHLAIDIKYRIKTTRDTRSLVYPFYLRPDEA